MEGKLYAARRRSTVLRDKILQRLVSEEERRDKYRYSMLQKHEGGSDLVFPAEYRVTKMPTDREINNALSDLQYVTMLCEAAFSTMKGSDIELFCYEKMYKARRDIIQFMCTSRPYDLDPDIRRLIIELIMGQLKKAKAFDYKELDAKLSDLRAMVKVKELEELDDPAEWYNSGRKLPYSIFKFIKDKKIPPIESVQGICADYSKRYRHIELRIRIARDDVMSEGQWRKLFEEKESITKQWKDSMLIVCGKDRIFAT
jgi:hypothetical protein